MRDIVFFIQTEKDGEIINSFNGQPIRYQYVFADRLRKKNNLHVYSEIIKENLFYKYETEAIDGAVCLYVYEGHLERDCSVWEKVYTAKADISHTGIEETGDCDIHFWHEYFATGLGAGHYDEWRVSEFEMNDGMKEVRKVFLMELAQNPFIFFEKYKYLKKYFQRDFDKSIFDIPMQKINNAVGKVYDGEYINYVIQHEVELAGDVFFDLKVLSGRVENGIINVEKKNRFFITSGFWHSPDGGDISVLVKQNTFGPLHNQKMAKAHPEFLFSNYDGQYTWQYVLSRGFIPCFEILAKAGQSYLADIMLDTYYKTRYKNSHNKDYIASSNEWQGINIWGKNDKEIFGFKMSKLKNMTEEAYEVADASNFAYRKYLNFTLVIRQIKRIIDRNPFALERHGAIYGELFKFLSNCEDISEKTIEYIKQRRFDEYNAYIDYRRICNYMKMCSGGLYPDNIKREHDVMVAYMNQLKQAERNQKFEEIVLSSGYKELLYNGDGEDGYCILAPRKPSDIADEGYRLHHCVQSYIPSVCNGSTKIYFLRRKNRKGSSLVTIEVKGIIIKQARGSCNRSVTKEEKTFIDKWASEKNLIPDFYHSV